MADAKSDGSGLLAGKAVVVTGGGRGLGEAVCKAVAAAGARVVVNDVDPGPAEACVAAIKAAGGQAVAHVADIGEWKQGEALIERCIDEYGKIDGLVNNAGIQTPGACWELTEAAARKVLDVNVIGTLACATRAIKAMRAQGSGSIINTTSGASMGLNYYAAYSTSKGAVSSYSYTAALELKGSGVRVNIMSPFVMSRLFNEFDEFMQTRGGWNPLPLPPAETNTPLHVYLLSDLSRHVTGQVLGIRFNGELYVGSHPAILEPTLTREAWTPLSIAEVIDKGLLAPFQHPGVSKLRLAGSDTGA